MPIRPFRGCRTKQMGDASEALVLGRLVAAGISVLVPWGDSTRFDLMADFGTSVLRIQCKTGRQHAGYVTFRTFGVGRDGNRYRYMPGEIDYYAVRCLETGAIYLVPYEEAGSSPIPHFRVDPPRANSRGGHQVARIRWAAKYAADVVIESWLRTGGDFEPRWAPPTSRGDS